MYLLGPHHGAASYCLRTLPLARAATVVRVGRVVDDRAHVDAGGLDGADGLLASGTGSADDDVHLRDAHVLGLAGGVRGRELRGVGRALLGALVADGAGGGPGDGVAAHVRDRDDGVVVGSVDERLAFGDLAPDSLLARLGGWGLGHDSGAYFLKTFFLPATVRRGPLRVRALVLVDWPRTGRPRRCRRPR